MNWSAPLKKMGNAGTWDNEAAGSFEVGPFPQVGAIAVREPSCPSGSPSCVKPSDQYGHVGYVTAVNCTERTITLSEMSCCVRDTRGLYCGRYTLAEAQSFAGPREKRYSFGQRDGEFSSFIYEPGVQRPAACNDARVAPAPPPTPPNATWAGGGTATSSLGTPARVTIRFNVAGSLVKELEFPWRIDTLLGRPPDNWCGAENARGGDAVIAADGSFTISGSDGFYNAVISGRIAGATASGTVQLQRTGASDSCGSATIPWTATRR